MLMHEPGDARCDQLSNAMPQPQLTRQAEDDPKDRSSVEFAHEVTSSDDTQAASELMSAEATLSRLGKPDPARVPPGRQLSGEPPAP
jgi:hypothetical protein